MIKMRRKHRGKNWELLRNYMDTLDLIQFGAEDEKLIAFQEWKYHDLSISGRTPGPTRPQP